MRYHISTPEFSVPVFGKTYICDHPVYSKCTLYTVGARGLAIIQQRYDAQSKTTWWTDVDSWIVNAIFLHARFPRMFEQWSAESNNGIFPAITVRQAMWYLRMKPLKREPWETAFDHKPI